MSEVVLMSSTKSECGVGRVKAIVGCGECGFGGFERYALTEEEKSDKEMVRETGKRAKEAKG
ncbi:hypothetical protein TRAPUB_10775 [Trametes pubescens]|uniref:Uncharacterized protein n=1 Tax=Trametes pubescens TaxID=154538 RepID=A0A1M2VYK1_TRAPU|nr:hypothetical protein TRAPUB_10775 [Trametes pubescens]